MKFSFSSIGLVLILAGVVCANEKYLMLDSRVVEQAANARLRVGTVVKHPANPLFKEDRPWEVRFDNLYANILYDADEQLYKCWYSPFIRDVEDKPPMSRWDKVPYQPRGREMGVCYATSKDGLKWEKPELGLVEFDGSTANNLVLRGPHGAGVFKDLDEEEPRRRYKMFYKGSGSMKVRFSPDGLCWDAERPAAGVNVPGDTHNNAFWSPELDRYVAVTRMREEQRLVARTESADFLAWTPAVEVLRGDVQNQTYAMPVFCYGDVYLGLVMILRRQDDRVHCELAWSPDSVTWHRVDQGNPLTPLAEEQGRYDWGCAYAAAYPVVMPDGGIRLYYGASNGRHTSWRDGFLALATLRPDGWAGYEPVDADLPATIQTGPLTCRGGTLRLTADAANGTVSVAVLDKDGKVVTRSKPMTGDVTGAAVPWQNDFALSQLAGTPVRLVFEIRRARVYSFSLDPRQEP
jgi:hypothetical protein